MNFLLKLIKFLSKFNQTVVIEEGAVVEGSIEQSNGTTKIVTEKPVPKTNKVELISCGGMSIGKQVFYFDYVLFKSGLKIEVPKGEKFRFDGNDENMVLYYRGNQIEFSGNSISSGKIIIDGVTFSK